MNVEDGVVEYIQRRGVARLTAEKAEPNCSGVRALMKLNSIDSEGATALSSSMIL